MGFVRFGWRDYDVRAGRWTAPDPIGDKGGDPDWYGYCLDDPVNGVDPLGLLTLERLWLLAHSEEKNGASRVQSAPVAKPRRLLPKHETEGALDAVRPWNLGRLLRAPSGVEETSMKVQAPFHTGPVVLRCFLAPRCDVRGAIPQSGACARISCPGGPSRRPARGGACRSRQVAEASAHRFPLPRITVGPPDASPRIRFCRGNDVLFRRSHAMLLVPSLPSASLTRGGSASANQRRFDHGYIPDQ
ncbi:MAG: RHS repeat-associated core domain-containing protein [Pseudodesulfovibrio sp.]|uniref:RHS repeat-associated core domain-containing protein n=1 Tax=Pseudodesulfovibrio sp. TaxID=2035812 RepID=UPI003D0C81DE